MGMTDKNLCDSCTNIGCMFQSGIVRTECAFYMPPQLEPDNCGNYVVQGSTTKNDIRDNGVKNELNRVKNELDSTTKNDLPQTMEELFKYLTDKIPSWKVIFIDKWTDFKVWLWIKTHKGADRWE